MFDGFRPRWMTAELDLLRAAVKRFCESEIAPHYEKWERDGCYPRELWRTLGAAGYLNCDIPEEYGGAGADYTFYATVIEEISRQGYLSISAPGMGVHSGIVAHYLLNQGSEEQRRRYLPAMATGDCVGAIAMTEPAAGSDLQGIRTRATVDGDHLVLRGQKTFISNGQHCDFVIVVAKTDPDAPGSKGTSLLIVDADAPGFSRGRNLEKIGMHSADTSELFFDEVRLPRSALLGPLHGGFGVLMQNLPRERLGIAVSAIGACEGMLAWTLKYVQERQLFGQTVGDFQGPRHSLAELLAATRTMRAFVDDCVALLGEGTLDTTTASMVKLGATELEGRVADGCLQLFGGYGYMREYPISRAFVDARVQRIYGGTSEVMKEVIIRSVLGKHSSR